MDTVTLHSPKKIVFGTGCLIQMSEDIINCGIKRLFIISIDILIPNLKPYFEVFQSAGISVRINTSITSEPYFSEFEELLKEAIEFNTDCVLGIGGGSVLDLAKLVAVQLGSTQKMHELVGNGLISTRKTQLKCVPTTSGTGSEVSPNSILIDDTDGLKKGIISPFLVPDAAYIDPEITIALPKDITAFTGIDALTHCIEAYTNKFSHPMIDTFAIKGIELIGNSLLGAVKNGNDIAARSNVALGSVYGGMCLGPVNTAAVHALAYPLGTLFKIPHGLSNAILLPYVMEYSIDYGIDKYANIGKTLGVENNNKKETALGGIQTIRNLNRNCGVPENLTEIKINKNAVNELAESAYQVQRLLKNNIRPLKKEDIYRIYERAL
jgi:alcohol dehydrogenase class IV